MDENILDPEGGRERPTTWRDRIGKLAADTQTIREQLAGLRITAADPNGLAEVTIDSTGVLVDVRLTERMRQATPEVVAQAVLATLGDAKRTLADRSQEIIADTMGTESPAARAIAKSVDRRLRGAPARPADDDAEDPAYDISSDVGQRW